MGTRDNFHLEFEGPITVLTIALLPTQSQKEVIYIFNTSEPAEEEEEKQTSRNVKDSTDLMTFTLEDLTQMDKEGSAEDNTIVISENEKGKESTDKDKPVLPSITITKCLHDILGLYSMKSKTDEETHSDVLGQENMQ